jgi:hypothetical protein
VLAYKVPYFWKIDLWYLSLLNPARSQLGFIRLFRGQSQYLTYRVSTHHQMQLKASMH